jgi:hypothetical protein
MKKPTTESQLLQLLKKVLPKATTDPKLAGQIYEAVENELRLGTRASSFQKFCARMELPDLEPESIKEVQIKFEETFKGADITLQPDKKEKLLAVEVVLPDSTPLSGEITVGPKAPEQSEEQEIKLKYVPFPVCMPGDKELVWLLGKREDLSPDEAGIAVTKAEEDFWGSKTGQKLLRDRVDRTFPEFISRVPAGLLSENGLKRHYKTGEAIKVLRAKR